MDYKTNLFKWKESGKYIFFIVIFDNKKNKLEYLKQHMINFTLFTDSIEIPLNIKLNGKPLNELMYSFSGEINLMRF